MTTPVPARLFLASRSPRRAELLRQIGLAFEVIELDLAEVPLPGEAAGDYVRRLAREKAGAGLLQVAAVPGAVVIGADTEVVLDGDIFGKPADAAEAAAMLARLSGREHQVYSAVAVVSAAREAEALSASRVSFATLSPAAIADYVASGEAFGKAGAYGIQGRAAAFVRHLAGSYSGVMGLPLHETVALLAQLQPGLARPPVPPAAGRA